MGVGRLLSHSWVLGLVLGVNFSKCGGVSARGRSFKVGFFHQSPFSKIYFALERQLETYFDKLWQDTNVAFKFVINLSAPYHQEIGTLSKAMSQKGGRKIFRNDMGVTKRGLWGSFR